MTDKFAQGGVVAVIGICTVFIVLAILWGVLELMRVFFTKDAKKEKKPAEKAAPAPAPMAAVAKAPVASAAGAAEDEELIAVLAAAVAAYLGQPVSRFQIKNYRRIDSGTPIWNRTARRDNLIG
ncbi:MAG: methylmalonyl-CoA decarboxylase [Ruminococcaceae bacterium]|nr:methylmalonyl-CoA decarboxylase [Oscillospiraceae bacterium]